MPHSSVLRRGGCNSVSTFLSPLKPIESFYRCYMKKVRDEYMRRRQIVFLWDHLWFCGSVCKASYPTRSLSQLFWTSSLSCCGSKKESLLALLLSTFKQPHWHRQTVCPKSLYSTDPKPVFPCCCATKLSGCRGHSRSWLHGSFECWSH